MYGSCVMVGFDCLRSLYPVCGTPQSQQPWGNLEAQLNRAPSPETVHGGDEAQTPAAGFTLGRFQVSLGRTLI